MWLQCQWQRVASAITSVKRSYRSWWCCLSWPLWLQEHRCLCLWSRLGKFCTKNLFSPFLYAGLVRSCVHYRTLRWTTFYHLFHSDFKACGIAWNSAITKPCNQHRLPFLCCRHTSVHRVLVYQEHNSVEGGSLKCWTTNVNFFTSKETSAVFCRIWHAECDGVFGILYHAKFLRKWYARF